MRKDLVEVIGITPKDGVLYKAKIAEKVIKGMSKEDFHQKVVKKTCKNPVFGELATFGAGNLSERDRITIRGEFSRIGIPPELTDSNFVLNRIAVVITARSVRVE